MWLDARALTNSSDLGRCKSHLTFLFNAYPLVKESHLFLHLETYLLVFA